MVYGWFHSWHLLENGTEWNYSVYKRYQWLTLLPLQFITINVAHIINCQHLTFMNPSIWFIKRNTNWASAFVQLRKCWCNGTKIRTVLFSILLRPLIDDGTQKPLCHHGVPFIYIFLIPCTLKCTEDSHIYPHTNIITTTTICFFPFSPQFGLASSYLLASAPLSHNIYQPGEDEG